MGQDMLPHHGTTVSAWDTTTFHVHRKVSTPLNFSWGHKTHFLFPNWPGSNPGMYAVSLIFVFTLAVVVEFLNYCSIIKPGTDKVATGFFQTGLHIVRSGLSYMVMLAVMSYNGGVFLAAVGGHAFGFVIFGSRAFKKSEKTPDLPSPKI
ncbi:hypothetical protein K2173_019421 [Erythroxylum novogranatense]|uniref:Copper transport protein n=1 Tax=Erythroxylum novogranatense TaxID=1862640 RepID=A0AAV8UES3_9ROSI|nr:hypothetical protein K2173_019421 [Erythroxylum novogranatense]